MISTTTEPTTAGRIRQVYSCRNYRRQAAFERSAIRDRETGAVFGFERITDRWNIDWVRDPRFAQTDPGSRQCCYRADHSRWAGVGCISSNSCICPGKTRGRAGVAILTRPQTTGVGGVL
jgi:hypothetical protein